MLERVGDLSRFHGVSTPTFHKTKRGAPGSPEGNLEGYLHTTGLEGK